MYSASHDDKATVGCLFDDQLIAPLAGYSDADWGGDRDTRRRKQRRDARGEAIRTAKVAPWVKVTVHPVGVV